MTDFVIDQRPRDKAIAVSDQLRISQSEINRQTCERMELARDMSSYANWSEMRDLYVKMLNMPVAMTPSGITDIARLVYDGFTFHEVDRKMLLVIARRKTKG